MESLTQCEYQVAHEVAKGHTPLEIADMLKKSVWTIKAQIRDIHKKYDKKIKFWKSLFVITFFVLLIECIYRLIQ